VTIIAGFKCEEGVVVCADTQETLGTAKRSVPKLRFEPSDPQTQMEEHESNLAVAFCGAGDGPFIDKLVNEAWSAAKQQPHLNGVCSAIETSIKRQYSLFGKIYQRGMCPEVQLIYGVKMNGESKLFTASGPIVNEKHEYDSGGQGHYMADFLASKMHYGKLNIRQCAILAAYVLHEAKNHVDGCGGDSQIAVLRNKGTCGTVGWHRIGEITDLVSAADSTAGDILMALTDVEEDDTKAIEQVQFNLDIMAALRNSYRERTKRQESPEFHQSIDFLGLPSPKTDQQK
jgi:hypothetical protein